MVMEQIPRLQQIRTNPRLRVATLVGALLAVGALFSLANVSLVQAASAGINVPQLSAPVPATDPFSPLWNQAQPADIPAERATDVPARRRRQRAGGAGARRARRSAHRLPRLAGRTRRATTTSRTCRATRAPSSCRSIR